MEHISQCENCGKAVLATSICSCGLQVSTTLSTSPPELQNSISAKQFVIAVSFMGVCGITMCFYLLIARPYDPSIGHFPSRRTMEEKKKQEADVAIAATTRKKAAKDKADKEQAELKEMWAARERMIADLAKYYPQVHDCYWKISKKLTQKIYEIGWMEFLKEDNDLLAFAWDEPQEFETLCEAKEIKAFINGESPPKSISFQTDSEMIDQANWQKAQPIDYETIQKRASGRFTQLKANNWQQTLICKP